MKNASPFQRFTRPESLRRLQIFAGVYLIYLAVVARVLLLFDGDANLVIALELLGVYGGLLAASHWLYGRSRLLRAAYLVAQMALVLGFAPLSFEQEFFPILFIPLGLQAVLFFGKRSGYVWIGALAITVVAAVLLSAGGRPVAFTEAILYIGALIFISRYANLNQEAETNREHNQRLLEGLRASYRQVLEYSARIEEYAVQQERARMARELHDSVTQTIFSMNLSVQAAQLLAKDPQRMVEQLDRLQELASSAVGEFRVLANQLSAPILVEEGLAAALRHLADEREARDGLRVSLTIVGERALPEPAAASLYRIAQEALANSAKHAGAPEAAVCLHLERPAWLEIVDRGKGFDQARVAWQGGHLGLQGMAERAREIGWRLKVESAPGRGTTVRVEEAAG